MLVLSRKKDETIVIGGIVEVMIVEVRGDKVRLGIKAPPEVTLHRKEVQRAIDLEKQATTGRESGSTEWQRMLSRVWVQRRR